MYRLLVLVVVTGCATLDQSTLSPACRGLYNACLNTCPSSGRRSSSNFAPGTPTGDSMAYGGSSPTGNNTNLEISVAECTKRCNEDAKACR